MITEKDLQEAIAECKKEQDPNANTCIKLAAFLTIQREMFGRSYSGPPADVCGCYGDGEFAQAIAGRKQDDVFPVVCELMDTLSALNPRLHAAVIRKIKS